MIRPVLVFPDRRLKARAVALRHCGAEARRLAGDLQDTARAFPRTVGLAATQIGVMWRMVYVDCTDHPAVPDAPGPMWFVNPVVEFHEGAETGREGCLSLPDITANVRRPTHIRVRAKDVGGTPFTYEADGFEARVILHEIDHLDGVLILDRVASLARDVFPRVSGRGRRRGGADPVVRAATLARIAHAGQRYAGGPYERHLQDVVDVLAEAGVVDPELLAAAWLHDVVEDTGVSREDLAAEFGERVAAIVDAVSVRSGRPSSVARPDSWTRTAATPGAVLVKLADRIANVRAGGPKVERYRQEQPRFRAVLRAGDPGGAEAVASAARLWKALESAVASGASGPPPAAQPGERGFFE